MDQTAREAVSAQFVVASGSLPPGVPTDFYQRIADMCSETGTRFILDTSGAGLQHIRGGVSVLKASVRELRECVGRDLATESEQLDAAHEHNRLRARRGRRGVVGSSGRIACHTDRKATDSPPFRCVQ